MVDLEIVSPRAACSTKVVRRRPALKTVREGCTSMVADQVRLRVEGRTARVSLNRPEALHALNRPVCEAINAALLAWRDDPAISLVILEHEGGRGFCAGGDVRAAAADPEAARAFFRAEYQMNALLHGYPKPIVAFMDGVVMGGGAGLAMPARYRVSTERTLFAMPETAIGLFPDVGAGWWLPKLPGRVGLWLALTGARLGPADCLLAGIATDHVPSDRLDALKAALSARPEAVETLLTEYEADAGEPALAQNHDAIERAFSAPSVEAVLARLDEDGSDWSQAQAAAMRAASPLTLKLGFALLASRPSSFEDEMAREYRLAWRRAASHDFREGVRALLIDKDRSPRWDPPSLDAATQALVAAYFAPLDVESEWIPLI
jgi:enoyl-CoA hydratase